LYDTLKRLAPSPLHSLNRSVADACRYGPQDGLERVAAVLPESVPARYSACRPAGGEPATE
jgi:RNA polymerase sigma-70 factor (ECF subfamily)